MDNALLVDLQVGPKLRISPLEIAIAYKLYLGSDKDFDDAAHIYTIFKNTLDTAKLKSFLIELSVNKAVIKRVLGEI